ncbi:MAG: hypothetical protein EOM21_20805 [Gammaproteobacteria bacterium]|nr:hypothetical protein [Gammaproteobacteria bacterium]
MTTFKFKLTSQVALEVLESNARTFGELKRDIQNSPLGDLIKFDKKTEMRNGVQWESTIKLIEKNTKVEYYNIDEAIIPQGETVIFFVLPFEHKGGMVGYEDIARDIPNCSYDEYPSLEEEIMELGYNEIRKLATLLKKDLNADIEIIGKRADILFNVLSWLHDYLEKDIFNPDELAEVTPISEAIDLLTQAIEVLRGYVDPDGYYADTTTLSELHVQALDLQRRINS